MCKFDDMFMNMALLAAHKSKATKRKVGAIAVKDGNVIGIGINGTPTGWYTNEDTDNENTTKNCVLHAEENLITKLARGTASSDGATLFCTTAPCAGCSRLILQAGFKRVVYLDPYKNEDGLNMLRQMGLEVIKFKG